MPKSSWIILLLFAAAVAPNAYGDDYSLTFSGGGFPNSPAVTAPDVEWNPGQPLPDIDVTLTLVGNNGTLSFDLLSPGLDPLVSSLSCPSSAPFPCFNLAPAHAFGYGIWETFYPPLIPSTDLIWSSASLQGPILAALTNGPTYYVTFTDTPEPSTAALLLAGIALMALVMRKRIAHGFSEVS
jgi:hypothetical protein